MANINVAIVNQSTVVTDAAVQPVVAALQKQVRKDFGPVWGVDADVAFVPYSKVPAGSWVLAILDNSDQAGALGYHDITKAGLPLGKVFAKTDAQYGEDWAVTTSHELLEMLADPDINLTAFVETSTGGVLYAYEVCDACEDEQFAYTIDGVKVSDFVTPAWFESFRKNGPFDFKNHIEKPFHLLTGGYIGIYDVTSGSGWQQLNASQHRNDRSRPRVGSRRERRRTSRAGWVPSSAV